MFRTRFILRCTIFFLFSKGVFLSTIAFSQTPEFLYGGQVNSTFSNIKGNRSSSSLMSGYGWALAKKPLSNQSSLNFESGISFEKSDNGQILVNQSFLEYDYDGRIKLSVGRMLEAAGRLHHDMIDYGAPAVGDNSPSRFFTSGNFPTNVAEQMAQPFANRVAIYGKPIENIALGLSYTPYASKDNPAGYDYYINSDVTDSLSVAGVSEFEYRKFFIGLTSGYTIARYDDNRLYTSGGVYANQYSLYIRQAKTGNNYNMYEFGYGCLRGDSLDADCRAGWQIAHKRENWVYSVGFKRRLYSKRTLAFDDYSAGYMYYLAPTTRIGFEHILRIKKSKYDMVDGEFQWNFGISQEF